MTIAVFPLGLGAKILIVAAVIAGMYSAAWLLLMDDDDRRAVLAYLSTARAPIQAAITGAVD